MGIDTTNKSTDVLPISVRDCLNNDNYVCTELMERHVVAKEIVLLHGK
jgi:hypothetical protein